MYAEKVDHIEGHDEWRKRPDSLLYNHKVRLCSFSCLSVFDDVVALLVNIVWSGGMVVVSRLIAARQRESLPLMALAK